MWNPFKKTYRTLNTVKVSASALRHNLNHYRELLPGKAIWPVLKSNAYGHGLVQTAKVLEKEEPEFFVVDSLYEAYELQKAGIRTSIFILGFTMPQNLNRKALPFHFAVSDMQTLESFSRTQTPVHINIDTGMNRMGFRLDELKNILPYLKQLNVVGAFTHYADADNPSDTKYSEKQAEEFETGLDLLEEAGFKLNWIHTGGAASSASLKKKDLSTNAVRLGMGLYGYNVLEEKDPFHEKLKALQPALELHSTVVGVHKLKKGERVSYNGTFTAQKDTTIAMIPVGYYEALPRNLSNKGQIEVNGKHYPIIGRICMNYSVVDLGNHRATVGDRAIVYSSDRKQENSVAKQARNAKSIPYELVVRIAESIRREVI